MKPASIITLIVSVLIVVAGIITCSVAEDMADKAGQSLYSEIDSGNGNVRTFDFSDLDVNKIELNFNDAEVTVFGGSEKCYIEFINFKSNYYSLSTTPSLITFNEVPDITSILTFWESGFSFKGLRYVFNLNRDNTDQNGKKEVRIYLTDESTVKQLYIESKNCTLNVNDVETATDYVIVSDTVTLNTTNIMTSSALNINTGKDIAPAKKVTFNSNGDFITNISINTEELQMDARSLMCSGSTNINFDKGNAVITSSGNMKFHLESESGEIIVNSVKSTSPTNVGTSGGNISIISKSGNINVSTGALSNNFSNYN